MSQITIFIVLVALVTSIIATILTKDLFKVINNRYTPLELVLLEGVYLLISAAVLVALYALADALSQIHIFWG